MILPPLRSLEDKMRPLINITFLQGYCCHLAALQQYVMIAPGQIFRGCVIEYVYERDNVVLYDIIISWQGYRLLLPVRLGDISIRRGTR